MSALKDTLQRALGELKASYDDVLEEIVSISSGGEIDSGMIDGAIFHAESAVGRLQQLRETLADA